MSLFLQIRSSKRWILISVNFVLICTFQVYIFVTQFNSAAISEQDNTLRGDNVETESLESKLEWNELRERIFDLVSDHLNSTAAKKLIDALETKLIQPKKEPKLEYENLRRRVRRNTLELWNYFSSELHKIKKEVSIQKPHLIEEIRNVMELGAEHKRSLISDMDRMRMIDGYEKWRHDEAKSLNDLFQTRLHTLQNPEYCGNVRKLVCYLITNLNYGFGCQLHHMVYCFVVAYATERTLILESKNWNYHKAGWEDVFQPISETCREYDLTTHVFPEQQDEQVIGILSHERNMLKPPYLPLAIPADLAPRLMRLYGDPTAWFVGQFLKYYLHPQNSTHEMLEIRMKKLGFKKPIVGVHVRRTDKVGTEANFHNIEEYMHHVEDYFLQLELNGTTIKRRIFLASDDETVINEARRNYPSYEIISDSYIAEMAAVSTRFTNASLIGIISDMIMLSSCDYLVCTFSSHVCRASYEIMQAKYPDASNRIKSIDHIYYYGRDQTNFFREAFLPHYARNHSEIDLKPGDKIEIENSSNQWDGYSKGKNTRTNQIGLFPSFKINYKIDTIESPTYENVGW